MTFKFGSGQDGDVTISVNTDLGSANFKQYRNLTVNTGIELKGNTQFRLFVREKLTLTGNITVNAGAALGGVNPDTNGAAGDGGDSGGTILVQAKNIVDTGKIFANGEAGAAGGTSTDANADDGGDGQAAHIDGITPDPAVADGGDRANLGTPGTAEGTAGGTLVLEDVLKIYRTLVTLGHTEIFTTNGGSGSSGGGGHDDTFSGSFGAGGGEGGGGGSYIHTGGAGGDGGDNTAAPASETNSGGGGGGGGGSGGIVLVVALTVRTIAIESNGGVGGAGGNGDASSSGGGGGGGGGAGGVILEISKFHATTLTLDGGLGGAAGTSQGTAGAPAAGSAAEDGTLFFIDIGGV